MNDLKLHSIRLRNFRCYQEETCITFDDITALIGKNDAGKSTIMEALDIFLNDGLPDKDDASKDGDQKDLSIICEFTDLPSEVVVDDTNPTKLTEEFLLNKEGRLEIHKTYSGNIGIPKLVSVSAYALHPNNEGIADLLQLKNKELKVRAKQMGADLSIADQKVNAELRSSIRKLFKELELAPRLVPLNEDNAKDIWTGLKIYLPAFALFKSDRQSTDQDPEAQDPLKAAVKEAIKCKQADLDAVAAYVENEVRKIGQTTLEKLKEMDPTLATELNPQFAKPRWDTLFKASFTGDNDIPINKRGSGVKRLILLNFFRAKAELRLMEQSCTEVIYGIEEPETSQHPNNQRMLISALTGLSSGSQVIISTHTPMLARSLPDSSLRYIETSLDGTRKVFEGGEVTNKKFAKALGVLPDNNVKLFIGVEGKYDIAFLNNISKTLAQDLPGIANLEKMEIDGEIIYFPLGGSNLALWVSRLENLNRPEFHLYDRDTEPPLPPKHEDIIKSVNQREGCCARVTAKKEMENYIHWEAIRKAYKSVSNIEIPLSRNFAPFDDVPLEIAKIVHQASESPTNWDDLPDDKKKKKESNAKNMLNTVATKHMTKEMVHEIDLEGDLLKWFSEMIRLIDK